MRQRGVHRDVVAARARVRSRTSSRLRCVRQRGRSARRCGCRPRGKCGAVSCAAAAASTSRGTRHSASCAPKRRPTSVRPRLAPHSASSINARRQAPPRRRGGRRRRRGRPPPLTTAPSSHGELEAVSSQRGAKLDAAEPLATIRLGGRRRMLLVSARTKPFGAPAAAGGSPAEAGGAPAATATTRPARRHRHTSHVVALRQARRRARDRDAERQRRARKTQAAAAVRRRRCGGSGGAQRVRERLAVGRRRPRRRGRRARSDVRPAVGRVVTARRRRAAARARRAVTTHSMVIAFSSMPASAKSRSARRGSTRARGAHVELHEEPRSRGTEEHA